MFERFTDEARRALTVAQDEAKALDHDFIGTEHLLLGLLATAGGVAGAALDELGVTLDDARAKVTERVHPARTPAQSTPPFTPLAKKALERSLRNALAMNDSHIGPEHLLLGLIDVPDGGGAQVLADLAGSLDHSREIVSTHIGKYSAPPSKREAGSRRSRLWITRGGTSGGGSATAPASPAGEAPRCTNCHLSLVDHARHRVLTVPIADVEPSDPADPAAPADPPDPGVTVTVTVVYCNNCGTAVGVA